MADYSSLFQKFGDMFGVPPQLLSAVQQTESGAGNDTAVVGPSPASGPDADRAIGIMQIRGSNAKAAGIDPTNPVQAVSWAAQNLSQLHNRYGNWDDAVRAYHGGTNQQNWGPRTANYYAKVSSHFPGASAPQGQSMPAQQAQSNDGLLDPFAGASSAPSGSGSKAKSSQSAQPAQPQLLDPFAGASDATANAVAPQSSPDNSGPGQPGVLASVLGGVSHGLGSSILGVQQLAGKGLAQVPGLQSAGNWLANDATQRLNQTDADYKTYSDAHPVAAGAGNLVGSAAPALLLPGEGLVSGIGSTGARVAARAGVGAAQGAVMGAAQGVQNPDQDFWSQKADQIKSGAVGGAVAAPVAAAVGRVLAPVGSAAVRTLQNAGIRPTFGQAFGQAGSELEQKLTSIPFVGDLIRSGRNQAIGDFNRAIGNDALAPIGETVPANVAAGSEMNQFVADRIGQRYDAIARNGRVMLDQPLQNDIASLQAGIQRDAPALAGRFNGVVQNQILNKNGGNLTGDQWANTRSMINRSIRDHSGPNASSDDGVLAGYLGQLQDAITSNAEHYSNHGVQQDLAQANNAWARYKLLEKAAGSKPAQKADNVFTPSQYLDASRATQNAAQRATSAGGQGFPAQNLAQTAQPLLGNTVPDSGTAGRLGAMGLVAGTLMSNPLLAAKGALAALPYLPGVRNIAPALVTARPAAVRAVAPYVARATPGTVGGLLGQSVSQGQPTDLQSQFGLLGQ
ncbi:transglycosylase SLT domain-containing protein [Paraburkholderia caribensis]|uniref:transglycosylase SLT domain-containing protein n=1 Tax=Paraburkholderia caribensis TaxID=75105 RepID=UPI0020909D2D|nr:lytic transglycosylase domain-containing protein [Paraburkholderia caribensis]